MNGISHNKLASSLADWLRSQRIDRRRMTWENLEFCDNRPNEPYVKCRPDVFSLRPVLDVSRSQPWSHEVKVSRADFLSDVRSGKWQNYKRFSCRIFFACPAGLIEPHEVPEGAGLWHFVNDRWEELADVKAKLICNRCGQRPTSSVRRDETRSMRY